MLRKGEHYEAPLNEGLLNDDGSSHPKNNQENSSEKEQSRDQDEQEIQSAKKNRSHHVNPATLEKYLSGIHFPCDQNKLIHQAQQNKAPESVLSLLGDFSKKTYKSVTDIAKEVGVLE